jgi:hypothetical protein
VMTTNCHCLLHCNRTREEDNDALPLPSSSQTQRKRWWQLACVAFFVAIKPQKKTTMQFCRRLLLLKHSEKGNNYLLSLPSLLQ